MLSSTTVNRRYKVNENYFDDIDTERKAYWLGFLWADGSIGKTSPRSSGPNRLRLAQKWSEKAHLDTFRQDIDSDYRITRICHAGGHDVAQLDINCRPLCASLERLGYGTKNCRIHIPNISHGLLPHFTRGYFDGDGCLSVYVQQIGHCTVLKQEWSITGKTTLVQELKDLLNSDAGVTPTVKLKRYKRSPTVASLRYGKHADIVKLYNYLYANASVYLNAKHQKFVDFFSRDAS